MFFKQVCVDCHYFCKQYRDDRGEARKLEVTKEHRKKTKNDDFSWRLLGDSMGCYKGVWDQGHNFPLDSAYEVICKENRKGRCYYWRHMPGTFMHAVEGLQT